MEKSLEAVAISASERVAMSYARAAVLLQAEIVFWVLHGRHGVTR